MAISLDAVATKYESGSVGSTNLSFTNAGNLLVVMTRSYDASHIVTGVTFNSVSMTQDGTGDSLGADTMQRWYLISPFIGTANITVSNALAGRVDIGAISLFSVNTTGQPDASGSTTGSSTTATRAITTVADNCWSIMTAFSNGASGAWSSGTNCTVGSSINDRVAIGYGGPNTPAGSFTQTINIASGGGWGVQQMSFSPAATTVNSGFFNLM